MQFTGLSAFPITPASEQGVVDVVALEKVLLRLKQAKVNSVGLLGSLDLLGALTAAGASGDFGSYMLDAGTGREQDVAAFAVSVVGKGRRRAQGI